MGWTERWYAKTARIRQPEHDDQPDGGGGGEGDEVRARRGRDEQREPELRHRTEDRGDRRRPEPESGLEPDRQSVRRGDEQEAEPGNDRPQHDVLAVAAAGDDGDRGDVGDEPDEQPEHHVRTDHAPGVVAGIEDLAEHDAAHLEVYDQTDDSEQAEDERVAAPVRRRQLPRDHDGSRPPRDGGDGATDQQPGCAASHAARGRRNPWPIGAAPSHARCP